MWLIPFSWLPIMVQKIKINSKRYWPISLVILVGALLFARSFFEGTMILLGYLLVLLNQWVFLKGLEGIFELYFNDNSRFNKSKIVFLFLRKILFFIGIFFLGVQFLGTKVIIIVVLYLLQTLVLVYAKEGWFQCWNYFLFWYWR